MAYGERVAPRLRFREEFVDCRHAIARELAAHIVDRFVAGHRETLHVQRGRIGAVALEMRVEAGATGLYRFELDVRLVEGALAAQFEQCGSRLHGEGA